MTNTQDKPLKTWVATGGVAASTYIGKIRAATAEEALKKAWDSAHVSVCHHCSSAVSDPEVTAITVESADGESLSSEDEKSTPPKRTFKELTANPPKGWKVSVMDGGHGVQFCRRNASGRILAIFGVLDGKVTNDWVAVAQGRTRQPMTLAERIAIHRDIVTILESLAP